MAKTSLPPNSQEICQKLFRGYQFSKSDLFSNKNDALYDSLNKHFTWFQDYLATSGFSLIRDDGIIFLEKEDKALSKEEKQTVVVLFLLVDLWLENGKAYSDLFELKIAWKELDWFREGYGRDYLIQVSIDDKDFSAIEDLFARLAKKGFLEDYPETSTVTLREPAERLLNIARKIHRQMKVETGMLNE